MTNRILCKDMDDATILFSSRILQKLGSLRHGLIIHSYNFARMLGYSVWQHLAILITAAVGLVHVGAAPSPHDPCEAIAGKLWVHPSEARACLSAFPLDPVIKANVRKTTL